MTVEQKLIFLAKMVKTEQTFKVYIPDTCISYTMYFHKDKLYIHDTKEHRISNIKINDLLLNYNFQLNSFIPSVNDTYWYIKNNYTVVSSTWQNKYEDYTRYYAENCFKTEKEARNRFHIMERIFRKKYFSDKELV